MRLTHEYLSMPVYVGRSGRSIGVLQQLQTLLGSEATLADVLQIVQGFQQEFGAQEQLENVIQLLVGHCLLQQVAWRKMRS